MPLRVSGHPHILKQVGTTTEQTAPDLAIKPGQGPFYDLNSPIQGLAQTDLALQGLVDEGEEFLPVLG